jgi:hypothetical protein
VLAEVVSHLLVIPEGGAITVALVVTEPKNNSMSAGVVVVIDGAVIASVLSLYRPACASMGDVVSTPVKSAIPPDACCDELNFHVYVDGSAADTR